MSEYKTINYIPPTKEEFIDYANLKKREVLKKIDAMMDKHMEAMMFPREVIFFLDEITAGSDDFMKILASLAKTRASSSEFAMKIPEITLSSKVKWK